MPIPMSIHLQSLNQLPTADLVKMYDHLQKQHKVTHIQPEDSDRYTNMLTRVATELSNRADYDWETVK